MGIEENRRERRIGARPCEEKKGFSRREFKSFKLDTDRVCLEFKVGDSRRIIWVWVSSVDSEVVLEASYGRVFFILL